MNGVTKVVRKKNHDFIAKGAIMQVTNEITGSEMIVIVTDVVDGTTEYGDGHTFISSVVLHHSRDKQMHGWEFHTDTGDKNNIITPFSGVLEVGL